MQKSRYALPALVTLNLMLLSTLGAVLFAGFKIEKTDFDELSVKRINIVGPDGKLVIAISNKQRIAGPIMSGKEYPATVSDGRQNMAGMIFFNEEGDEMGGLVFNSFRRSDGKIAGIGHLSFDRYKDNQVVALQYKENAKNVQAGLTFYDRPSNGTFEQSLDLIHEAQSPNTSPERMKEIKNAFGKLKKDSGLGAERVFIGSRNRIPQLLLKDTAGRTRAQLKLDENNNAHLEFLDAAGRVTARFPE